MKKLIVNLDISLIAVLLFGCAPTPTSTSYEEYQQEPDSEAPCPEACGDGICGGGEFKMGLCPKDCDNKIEPSSLSCTEVRKIQERLRRNR